MKYKKIPNNKNAIMIDDKVVLSFNPRYKKYLKWRNENPDLEQQLVNDLKQEIKIKNRKYSYPSHEIFNKISLSKLIKKSSTKKGGIWVSEDGRLKIKAKKKDNKYYGEVIQYYENEIIVSRENYIDGILDGKYKYYHGNGILRQSGHIKNHMKDGEIKTYWETGNIKQIENYKRGLNDGVIESYRLDRSLIFKGNYVNNYKDGSWIWYYLNGKKMKQQLYESMVAKKITGWNEDGQKISEVEYDGMLYNGNYIVWYDNGNKKEHKIYKNNQLEGKWIEWHSNGIKRGEGNMKFGMMHGKWTFWYHNRKKELECEFVFGRPFDEFGAKIYHDNGILKEEV
jgi:antitoxin component YwqK of YwqJK toxin-antitoxin module